MPNALGVAVAAVRDDVSRGAGAAGASCENENEKGQAGVVAGPWLLWLPALDGEDHRAAAGLDSLPHPVVVCHVAVRRAVRRNASAAPSPQDFSPDPPIPRPIFPKFSLNFGDVLTCSCRP